MTTNPNTAALKQQLSEAFSQLQMPPALDQVEPEALASSIRTTAAAADGAALRIIDVRQPSEFAAGRIAGSVNMPHDGFDPASLVTAVAEDVSAGKKPQVVFVSSQSPDIDVNCAIVFVNAWDEAGLEAKTSLAAASIASTLLGGVVYWLQQHRSDAALTESYDAATWDAEFAAASATSPLMPSA